MPVTVDGVEDGVAHGEVLQRRVTVADPAGHAVERQLGEAALLAVDDLDVLVGLE